jgi:hypothetical protein
MANWLFKEIPVYKVYLGWLALLLFLCIIGLILQPPFFLISEKKALIIKARLDETNIATALKAYSNTYGVLPIGNTESVEYILTGEDLNGKNPQKIQFLNFKPSAEHSNEMVDSWETPYEINFSSTNSFIVSSAGKDKIFGDADDIIFNSVSNDFVKP